MLPKLLSYNNDKIEQRLWIWFIIVVVVNVCFRMIGLDYSSFWYDEIISVQNASLDFGHIKHVSEWDNNPPFYYYCLKIWISLFGDSEFTVRLLSVLFSAFAGGTLFVLCNRFFNKTTAYIASLLYLSSNMLFFYSHEARAYALSVLLCLLASWIFFNLKEKPDYKKSLFLGLINFLIIYTHYITGLALIVQGVCALFYFERKSKLKFLLSVLFTIVLVFIRFTKKQILLIIGFNNAEHSFWLGKSSLKYLIETLSEILFSQMMIIPLLLITLAGILFVIHFRKISGSFHYVFCFAMGFGCIIILYLVGKITPVFLDRYLLFSLPFVIILISFSLSYISYRAIPILLVSIFFIISAFTINYKTEKGMDYRGAVSFIKFIKAPGDLIIVKTKDVRPLFGYYYDKNFLRLQKNAFPETEHIIFCNSWEEVTVDVKKYNKVVVVDSYKEYNKYEKDFVKNLLALKPFSSETNYFKGVTIALYK